MTTGESRIKNVADEYVPLERPDERIQGLIGDADACREDSVLPLAFFAIPERGRDMEADSDGPRLWREAVGNIIKRERIAKGLSQTELAVLSGVNKISEIENGEKNYTLDTLDKICRALDLDLGMLFEAGVDESRKREISKTAIKQELIKLGEMEKKLLEIIRKSDRIKVRKEAKIALDSMLDHLKLIHREIDRRWK